MKPESLKLLATEAMRLGVALDPPALERFARLHVLLERWNARINLTRVVSEADAVAKHYLDSLAIVPHLTGCTTLLDVGAGPGFPSIPVAIALPHLAATLVEATQKKVAFLEAAKRELDLPLTIRAARFEELPPSLGPFDVAVSRATWAPPAWVERGARFVAPGGLLIAMLARERPDFTAPAGFRGPTWVEYSLPIEGQRALVLFRREAT